MHAYIDVYELLLRSHIHEYGHVQNRHVMFINDRTYKEHRNLNIRKHVTTSCSGTKPFYKLWVKGFDVRRRDTIFYAVLLIWPPTRAAPIGRTFASRLRAPKIDPSRSASKTRLLFSSNSHTNFRVLSVRDVTRTLSPSIVSDCYDIWVTSPSARAHPR